MALVEGIRCEGTPVVPNLLESLRVVSVGLSALNEFGVHVVQLVNELLTHRLAQGITLATGEIGYFPREQHDLLLVNGDAVSVLEVLLHTGEVVGDRLIAMFSGYERRDVLHGTRAVKGVHGDEVLKSGGLELAQILLHTCRLELERTDCAAVAIELVGGRVVNVNFVDVEFYAQ